MSKVTYKEFGEMKEFLKKGEDYAGAMKKFHRGFTTVRRVFLSDNWWEFKSRKSVRQLKTEKEKPSLKLNKLETLWGEYEQIPDERLEKAFKWIRVAAGFLTALEIVAIAALAIFVAKVSIDLIGGLNVF